MAEVKEEKVVKAPIVINRGRMPALLVFMARFSILEMTVPAAAKSFCTTVGKISDIRKVRNFAYITETFKPTQEDVDAAVAYLEECKGLVPEDVKSFDILIEDVKAMDLATEEDIAAYDAIKASKRKRAPKKEKEEAPAEDTAEVEEDALADLVAK